MLLYERDSSFQVKIWGTIQTNLAAACKSTVLNKYEINQPHFSLEIPHTLAKDLKGENGLHCANMSWG